MGNKKIIFLIAILVIIIVVLISLYFKYWYEPRATYFETDDAKLIKIRADLKQFKAELRKKGKYSCCIRGDCDWCAISMGHCICADLVMEEGKEKSCPECAAAWDRKRGKIPGVDPDAIEVTTFGVYGYEKDGHHHPDVKKQETIKKDAPRDHEEEHHH